MTGSNNGGWIKASLSVTPGQQFYILVGGAGGFNGGGTGAGASDIRTSSNDLRSRVIVAGAGGYGYYPGVGGYGGKY